MLKSKKAFMFIITTLIIISLISLLIINIRTIPNNSKLINNLSENYISEFLILNKDNNLNIQKIDNFNNSFLKFINSHNYNVKICNIIKNNNDIYISNYLGEDCNLFIAEDLNRTINNNSTIKIDNFINNMPIYLCNCTYINYNNVYYIDIYNYNNQIINKNMR
jgi:hypothetical protein